jgi:hypothetical protein
MPLPVDKDWTLAPKSALIKPKWSPPVTDFQTGVKFEFKCESVGLLFVKDPYVLSVKYKNGTLDRVAGTATDNMSK